MIYWVSFFGSLLLLSGMLTWFCLFYALKVQLMDIPNHRSSHTMPTPKGGGLAFVICFIFALIFLCYLNRISGSLLLAIAGFGGLTAVIGLWDDNYSLPASGRLLGHFTVSIVGLYLLRGMPAISFYFFTLSPGWILNSLTVIYIVWMLNLYNFMDGIDGIAGVEVLTTCFSTALLYYYFGQTTEMLVVISLAVSVAGFLYWNFPPARIFMGDVGSGFLGYVLALLSIHAAQLNPDLFWSWLILLGVFIVDATFTLLNRFRQKLRIFEPHCSHAYQHASQYCGKHRTVTLGVMGINLFWLLPWAFITGNGILPGIAGLSFAYLPLIYLAYRFRAGKNT